MVDQDPPTGTWDEQWKVEYQEWDGMNVTRLHVGSEAEQQSLDLFGACERDKKVQRAQLSRRDAHGQWWPHENFRRYSRPAA